MGIMGTIRWLLLGEDKMELTRGVLDNMVISRVIFREGWIQSDKVDIIVVLAITSTSKEAADVKISITKDDAAIGLVYAKEGFRISDDFKKHATDRVKELVKPISKRYREIYYGPRRLI